MTPDYSKQKFLIIDDFAEFRFSVKGMLQQMGAQEIEMAGNAQQALELCNKIRFDVILSDYNLGDGQDGQQLLEELIHRELLKPTTVHVMVTAENTTEMVMGALEYTPDGYLTKPFTKALLKSRLDKLLLKKLALEPVNRAIITKDYPRAIKLCSAIMSKGSKYSMACRRIQADLFEKMGDYGQAKTIYEAVIAQRPVPWALMGMGKIYYAQEDYEEALALFRQVIKDIPTFPEALDWLARVQQALGQLPEAQATLQSAVRVSKKAILRQMHLGNLALKNNDMDVARRAFKASVKLGRNSCYKTPDNYLKLTTILRDKLDELSGVQRKRTADEAFRVLDELEKDYDADKEIKLRAKLARHSIYMKLDKQAEADKQISQSKMLYNDIKESLTGPACADMARSTKEAGDFETCQEVVTNILEKYSDDKELMASLDTIIEDKAALQRAAEASRINNEGIRAATNNDLDAAAGKFKQALSMSPENITFNLNLAQVYLRQFENDTSLTPLLNEALQCLGKLQHMRDSDHRYLRYQQLLRSANDLNIGAS